LGEILAVFPRFTYGYTSHEQLIAIFEKHQIEIERIAVAKLQSGYVSLLGTMLTSEDLNP